MNKQSIAKAVGQAVKVVAPIVAEVLLREGLTRIQEQNRQRNDATRPN